MMKDQKDSEDYEPQIDKKTKKTKAAVPTITNRCTRRAHRKQSDNDFVLPNEVPNTISDYLGLYQSFERQNTCCIVQIPVSMFTSQVFSLTETTRVESIPLDIQIAKDSSGTICSLRLTEQSPLEQKLVLCLHGKYSWLGKNEVQTKVVKSCRKILKRQEWSEVVRFKIEDLSSDVFIVLSFRREEQLSSKYRGLINQGNTCYMNSYLQMLFHITGFRELLFAAELKEPDRFPAPLQLLFYRMLTEEKPVPTEQLVRSFGWSKKDVQVQQDAQEFSCLFFEVLERTLPHLDNGLASVPDLFCGELTHYIQCCHVSIVLTQNRQRFYDLQLPIADNLSMAFDDYVSEQTLDADNSYRTEYYGLQEAKKGLRLSRLPPILMIQLKRFDFNPYTESNQKILDRCSYPQHINFSKWTIDQSYNHSQYDLYAVLVHEGSQASSGHYYIFVNLQDQWYKFNDERVEKVNRQKALDYNFGGMSTVNEYDTKQMKVIPKQIQNKTTAYMLVYISRNSKSQLFSNKSPTFPKWLIEQNQSKIEQDQEKKIRKQSICDIPLLSWQRNFLGKGCAGVGLCHKDMDLQNLDKMPMVAKNQKVEEWLSAICERSQEKQVYLYWVSNDKEVLVNSRNRACNSVNQLFKETVDPFLFLTRMPANKEQYFVIIKLFNAQMEPPLLFDRAITVPKTATYGELYQALIKQYPDEQFNDYYLQDRKLGLIRLAKQNDSLLPAPSPTRSQLLIAVVQHLQQNDFGEIGKWYKNQLNSIKVIFRNQSTKDEWQREISKLTTVQQLRQLIFDQILQGNNQFLSPHNIIVKFRAKKNSKMLSEAQDGQKLKELVKIQRLLVFSFSNLNAADRLVLRQLTFYCRQEDDLKLSDPIKIVIDKTEQQQKIVELIIKSQALQQNLPEKKGYGLRMFLLGRDHCIINDIVDDKGKIQGKGELATVLQRQKNSSLVVQQCRLSQLQEADALNILIHHVTKSGQKIGNPRFITVNKNINLSSLKYLVLDLLNNQSYEFQSKIYLFNPLKTRILAYVKDFSRATELPQPEQLLTDRVPNELPNQVPVEVKTEGKEPTEAQHKQKTDPEQKQQQQEISLSRETVDSYFGKCKALRIAVVHSYISKGTQALKLYVQ